MQPISKIKREHIIINEKLNKIEQAILKKIHREDMKSLFHDFEIFWAQHEEKEEKFFDWFAQHGGEIPFHKMIISQHEQLKGHWKIIKDFMETRSDNELEIALDTDGKMIIDKFRKHIEKEEEYFNKYFKKF